MAVVVGYVATKEGRAALRRAAEECELRHTRLIVINSQRGGKDFDADEAAKFEEELEAIQKKLTDLGLQNEVRQLVRGNEPAEDLIAVAEEDRVHHRDDRGRHLVAGHVTQSRHARQPTSGGR